MSPVGTRVNIRALDRIESVILTEMNFKTSSMTITGALRYKTAFHSIQLSGVIAKRVYDTYVKTMPDRQNKTSAYCEEWDIQNGKV